MDPLQTTIYALTFAGVVITTVLGITMFSKGWEGYEAKFLESSGKTMENMLLTMPPQHLLYLSVVSAFVGFVFIFLLLESFVIAFVIGVAGFFAPRMLLRFMRKRRLKKFNDQLIDALTTLNNALRSGFSLPKAIELIAKDGPAPLSQEFGIMVQELRLGAKVTDGLRHMYERMPLDDLDLLTTSVEISHSVGGNLTEVFEKISHTIRERHRIEGRIDAMTSQGKLQGLVVGLLPMLMALAYHYVDPDMLRPLYTTPEGYAVIGVMVIFEGLGFFFIRRITTIEV